jgi:colicin import membrane protein
MTEASWNRMLMISAALHLVALAAFSIPIKKAFRKFDTSQTYYSVNLVGDIGPGSGESVAEKGKVIPQTPPAAKEQKVPKKAKPVPTREKEKEARSIAPTKVDKPQPQTPTKDDLKSVQQRIKEMKERSGSQDVATSRGASGQGGLGGAGGGGRLIDPALARYLVVVRDRIETAWTIPFISGQKNLETKATIKVRKDGRVVDINLDKRSGNRVFDESVVRALRMIDPLPPLPSSTAEDPLEIELTLRPEGVS